MKDKIKKKNQKKKPSAHKLWFIDLCFCNEVFFQTNI